MAFQPETPFPDLDRLKVTLLKSGLQQKDNALYQVINTLIDYLRKSIELLEDDVAAATSGGSSTAIQIIQFLSDLSTFSDGEGNDLIIPGPRGVDGVNGMVPYFIAAGEKFTVPLFKQALFSMNIDNEGELEIEGFLIEVD